MHREQDSNVLHGKVKHNTTQHNTSHDKKFQPSKGHPGQISTAKYITAWHRGIAMKRIMSQYNASHSKSVNDWTTEKKSHRHILIRVVHHTVKISSENEKMQYSPQYALLCESRFVCYLSSIITLISSYNSPILQIIHV